MLVTVFMINCQVSENLNTGPVIIQTRTNTHEIINEAEEPEISVDFTANFSNIFFRPVNMI